MTTTDLPLSAPHPLYFGASWQPEAWPEDQWPLDIARMKELGINCVRLFQSAWHRFEPREWEFDFDWAVRILDQLRDAGISVILATPTAAPPAWMSAKYPEILRVTPDGRRVTHGSHRPYSVVSSRYREFCTRIVDQMVHAFRGHDAVIGWQIDDEISGLDFGSEARRAFHHWLHERFGQVESLNTTWGLELGSQAYEYFEQIAIPPIENLGQGPIPHARFHPSLMIAFQRFSNDQWSSFIQIQCDMIRAGFDKPISTNMTPNLGMNYFRQNHLLDRVAIDLDSISSRENAIIHFDRMRAEKPGTPFWQLAAPCDPALAWLSILSGGELLLLNHWRQAWSGPDMNTPALVTSAGRWSASKSQIATLAEQLRSQAEYLHDHPPVEARIAVIISNESAWGFSINPPETSCGAGVPPAMSNSQDPRTTTEFDYESIWRNEFHNPIAQSHYWRDVIDQTADFCPYHVIIMPLVPIVFRPTKERLKEWVSEGGCLLIGPLTGHRTEEFTAWTDNEFGGLEDLIGATCTDSFSTSDAPDTNIIWGTDPKPANSEPATPSVNSVLADAATAGGVASAAPSSPELPLSTPIGQCHAFTPTTAHVLARYQTAGTRQDAAILMNKVGQGTVITLGSRVDRESYLDLIHTLCELAKIETLAAGSPDVAIIPRMNPDTTISAYGVVNLTAQPQAVTLPKPGTDRLTNRPIGVDLTLQPNEVLLIEIETGAMLSPAAQ